LQNHPVFQGTAPFMLKYTGENGTATRNNDTAMVCIT